MCTLEGNSFTDKSVVERILKEGKHDEREKFISKLIEKTPNLKFDIYGI